MLQHLSRIIENCDTDESAVRELRNRGYSGEAARQAILSHRTAMPKEDIPKKAWRGEVPIMTLPQRALLARLAAYPSPRFRLVETMPGMSRRDVERGIDRLAQRGFIRTGPKAQWHITETGRLALEALQ